MYIEKKIPKYVQKFKSICCINITSSILINMNLILILVIKPYTIIYGKNNLKLLKKRKHYFVYCKFNFLLYKYFYITHFNEQESYFNFCDKIIQS